MRGFFGILFAALYKIKDKKDSLKHFLVYEEAELYGTTLMQQAFQLSYAITTKEQIMFDFEGKILHLSLQVKVKKFI